MNCIIYVMEQPPRFFALAYRDSDACIYQQEDITFPFVHYYNKFVSPTSILECNSQKIKSSLYIGMSYCNFHVDILKIHHFVCVFLNVKTKSLSFAGLWFLTVWTKQIVYADILYLSELLMRFMLHHCFLWRKAYNNFDRM
jgi:hypothetical protein